MKTCFEVLSQSEVERICAASFGILAEVGIKCEYAKAQELFRQAGAQVDENSHAVCIPEQLARWALENAPSSFSLYGNDPGFHIEIGGEHINFSCLGTPTTYIDMETGKRRMVTLADLYRHMKIVNALDYINNSQMDIWPGDIPMTTIHTEAIMAWAHHCRKSFGMGCFGYLPTLDMMRMSTIVAGGKEEMRLKPRFFMICSVGSPLQMIKEQVEGLLIAADYGQPLAMSPEEIAGSTAPVTLAGLLVHQTANILAHVTLAQIVRPGTLVLYATVSTISNMRLGTVALGAVETGLITAGAAQIARHLGLPIRSVGGTTESKLEDIQAGIERAMNTLQAVLAGVNFITCAGTLDSTISGSPLLMAVDDEIAGMALRIARGIEVNDETLALDLIRQVNFSSHYMAEPHTVRYFRTEHYIPKILVREPTETWEKEGKKTMLDRARERIHTIEANHQPRQLDPAVEKALQDYLEMSRRRSLEDYYAYEEESRQDFNNL